VSRRISALCSGRLADAVQARADEEGVTVSDVVGDALAAHLQRSGHLTRFYPQAAATLPPVKRPAARAKSAPRVLP